MIICYCRGSSPMVDSMIYPCADVLDIITEAQPLHMQFVEYKKKKTAHQAGAQTKALK